MGIHNYEKMYQSGIGQVKKAAISEKNKELILDFVNALVLENLSKPRLSKYLNTMKLIAERLKKDMDQTSIADIKSFIGEVQQNSNFSPWTKQSYKAIIRRFYKWLHGTKDYPEIVNWINIGMGRCEKRPPSEGDLLIDADVQKLIRAAEHPRDKALVAMLWESGARIGEIGTLSFKHVVFDKYGVIITVRGKTGSRKIRLISSTPYLSTWMNNHPFNDDPPRKQERYSGSDY